MGLVPTPEHDWAAESIDAAAQIAGEHVDLDAIYELIQDLPVLDAEDRNQKTEVSIQKTENRNRITGVEADRPQIGIFKDSAFQFYYPENIDALEAAGGCAVHWRWISGNAC
jgi:cobyrinic acid a,c-diamide synthase